MPLKGTLVPCFFKGSNPTWWGFPHLLVTQCFCKGSAYEKCCIVVCIWIEDWFIQFKVKNTKKSSFSYPRFRYLVVLHVGFMSQYAKIVLSTCQRCVHVFHFIGNHILMVNHWNPAFDWTTFPCNEKLQALLDFPRVSMNLWHNNFLLFVLKIAKEYSMLILNDMEFAFV